MPAPASLELEGVTQGAITQGAFTEDSGGNIYQEGHENDIKIKAEAVNVACLNVGVDAYQEFIQNIIQYFS